MKKTLAVLVFGGLVFNSGFAAVHSVGDIPQKGEGDFLLASEINTILNTISGIFFDDASKILEVAGTVKATEFIKSDGTAIGGSTFDNIFENGEKVGIGINNPSQKLDINDGNLEIRSSSPTVYLSDTDQRSGMIHVNSNLMYFLRGCGTGSESWCSTGGSWPLYLNLENNNAYFGNAVYGNSFVYHSDQNKKQNIKSLKNAVEVVQNLRGVEFEWKENNKKSIGFIAQEVEEILPELVHGAEGEKSVEYGNLTAILVEAVKTQQAQIEAQNARIAALELEVSK